MKKIALLLFLMIMPNLALAGGFKTEREIRSFTDKLINHFINSDFQKGLNETKPYWPLPEVEIDGMANQIKQQWPIVDQRFGKAIAGEFVGEKRIGKSFLRYFYLHKFENHAIYWQIDFYKPRGEWQINQITFRDKLDSLYE